MAVTASKPSSSTQGALRILHADPGYVLATWERHVIAVWRREISAPGVAIWSRAMAELQKLYPGQRVNAVAYIEPECVFADATVTSAASVDALKRFESTLAAVAIIYNREGFWNATMRGRFTAIHNESKTEIPYAMHALLPAAVAWLGEYGASDLAAHSETLVREVESLRAT